MPGPSALRRPLTSSCCWRSIAILQPAAKTVLPRLHVAKRCYASLAKDNLPESRPHIFHSPRGLSPNRRIKIYPQLNPPTTKDPISALTTKHLSILDPTGARQRLFSRKNLTDAIRVGDILQVRRKSGEPFAGVLINIRRRGVDTGFLLRNQLTRVGVEMWFKLYSPLIEGIDVVQRQEKRPKRAKLYYMRKPGHDIGSVQNIVTQYVRQRALLRGGGKKATGGKHGKKK